MSRQGVMSAPITEADSSPGLTALEQAMLEFERRCFFRPAQKERAIQDTFHMSPTRYFQIVNAMIDDPRIVQSQPVLINRLRRLRAARRSAR